MGSVLLVEETAGHGENHWPVASHWQTLLHNGVTPQWAGFELTTLVVVGVIVQVVVSVHKASEIR